ncbi:hypothetical protein BJ508DRAFT_369410 [Ascobolus immersus RN42]|uniref:Mitochondrial escape protein 2 n=1 Tax=Ascobolus immersus RN42 TaxID=1160509 RepID=A0A3N4IBJ7_ASCIM|nr:hypothetical protein BJ508DRAFT_369410 [Ascobolus immersus RN42]
MQRACSPRLFQAGLRPIRTPQQLLSIPHHPALRNLRFASSYPEEQPVNGTILTKQGEALLYYDNIYPVRTATWDIRYLINNLLSSARLDQQVTSTLEPPLVDSGFSITSIIPRNKDGGIFVKVASTDGVTTSLKEIEEKISAHLQHKETPKPWHSPWRSVKAYRVEGNPWVEDLHRYPSPKIRVDFVKEDGGAASHEVPQEVLYGLFRKYGQINDIVVSGKESPKNAVITFLRLRGATAAKNCIHGRVIEVGGEKVRLRVEYQRIVRVNAVADWVAKHPKIVLPLLVILFTSITAAMFDPVRTWFIEAKVNKSFEIGDNQYWGWLKRQTQSMIPILAHRNRESSASILLEDRKTIIDQLKNWLQEGTETFIVVQGAHSSGKRELVMGSILKGREKVLYVDCEAIRQAHGDSRIVNSLASQVGYRPVFAWANSLTSMMDLAAKGTVGVDTGLTQSTEAQMNKILRTTATALKRVALDDRSKDDKDAELSDDEYLKAHPEKRAVIVIDNFVNATNETEQKLVYDCLSTWASLIVAANVAHVIFLTNDLGVSKSLSKSLPDRVLQHVVLGDASPESARNYVLSQYEAAMKKTKKEEKTAADEEKKSIMTWSKSSKSSSNADYDPSYGLDRAIEVLGGRITELESLSRRMQMGETPFEALADIVETAVGEITKSCFSDDKIAGGGATPEQAYYMMKTLSEKEQVPYYAPTLHSLFKENADDALSALAQTELITINAAASGRPSSIKPGKPVYRAAFAKLLNDEVFKAKMELATLKALTKVEQGELSKALTELERLKELDGWEVKMRRNFLKGKMGASQIKIEDYEKKMGQWKKILEKGF